MGSALSWREDFLSLVLISPDCPYSLQESTSPISTAPKAVTISTRLSGFSTTEQKCPLVRNIMRTSWLSWRITAKVQKTEKGPSVLRVELRPFLFPLNSHVEVLTPSTTEGKLTWVETHRRYN